jgi:hypothetical protein
MRKIYALFVLFLIVGGNLFVSAQCNFGVSFGTATAPASGGSVTITTCAYAGEYQTLNSVVA